MLSLLYLKNTLKILLEKEMQLLEQLNLIGQMAAARQNAKIFRLHILPELSFVYVLKPGKTTLFS
jgi:hypothetical protein